MRGCSGAETRSVGMGVSEGEGWGVGRRRTDAGGEGTVDFVGWDGV